MLPGKADSFFQGPASLFSGPTAAHKVERHGASQELVTLFPDLNGVFDPHL
jgi:hypothetical protein